MKALPVVCVLALILAACGGSSGRNIATSPPDSSKAEASINNSTQPRGLNPTMDLDGTELLIEATLDRGEVAWEINGKEISTKNIERTLSQWAKKVDSENELEGVVNGWSQNTVVFKANGNIPQSAFISILDLCVDHQVSTLTLKLPKDSTSSYESSLNIVEMDKLGPSGTPPELIHIYSATDEENRTHHYQMAIGARHVRVVEGSHSLADEVFYRANSSDEAIAMQQEVYAVNVKTLEKRVTDYLSNSSVAIQGIVVETIDESLTADASTKEQPWGYYFIAIESAKDIRDKFGKRHTDSSKFTIRIRSNHSRHFGYSAPPEPTSD